MRSLTYCRIVKPTCTGTSSLIYKHSLKKCHQQSTQANIHAHTHTRARKNKQENKTKTQQRKDQHQLTAVEIQAYLFFVHALSSSCKDPKLELGTSLLSAMCSSTHKTFLCLCLSTMVLPKEELPTSFAVFAIMLLVGSTLSLNDWNGLFRLYCSSW